MAYKAIEEARKAAEARSAGVPEAVRLGLQMRRETEERKAALKQSLKDSETKSPAWQTLPEIGAHAYSDDRRMEVTIDARPWLSEATAADIQAMEAIEWGGDYEADEVYRSADAAGCGEAKRLSDYLATDPVMLNGDTVGFEVHMDREEALQWLAEHRPEVFGARAAEKAQEAPEASPAASAPISRSAGDIILTKKMVGAIAKAFAEPGKTSYLQRIDLIAQAIGYQNQATLMSVLGAADEGRAKAAPAQAPSSSGEGSMVIVAFGQGLSSKIEGYETLGSDYDGDITERTFANPDEAKAYIQGLEDMDGWMEFGFAAVKNVPRYETNQEFFREREADPSLTFEAYHDAMVERMRLEDEGEDDDPEL